MLKTGRIATLGVLLTLTAGGGVAVAGQGTIGDAVLCAEGTCEGTEERDIIVASNNGEEVIARGGDDDVELDALFLSGGNDVARGGEGRDCIDGGGGDDLMIGGPGDDNRPCVFSFFVNLRAALTGGPGNDRIEGGSGNDTMDGIFGDDLLLGGPGDDTLDDFQNGDSDRLQGGPGADRLNAIDGDRNDIIDGGPGNDICAGDSGDTMINCEVGQTKNGPAGDTTRPTVDVTGLPDGCVRKAFTITTAASDSGGLSSVGVRRGEQALASKQTSDTTDTSLTVKVPAAALRSGRHQVAVSATDEAGNNRTVAHTFRRCSRPKTRR